MQTPKQRVKKVYGYLTQEDSLLVFTQPKYPEAGIQVPGGSVEPDEPIIDAILREVQEETGIGNLAVVTFLGRTEFQHSNRIHERHYFHIIANRTLPTTWQHGESDPSEGAYIFRTFRFFWVPLTQVPPLVASMDEMIPTLIQSINL